LKSIKNSFSNCSICPLLGAPSCILETNCKNDLRKVDVVIVAENPGKEEVDKGLPLIGKAGQKFRQYFRRFKIDKLNYLLTNIVLCQTINKDGTTGNPAEEVINLCKENCFNIIEVCKPKLIVAMGTTPMSAFGIAKSGVTNLRGQVYKWKDYDVLLTVHPSFVNRNPSFESKFVSDLKEAAEMLGAKIDVKVKKDMKVLDKKGVYYYKIPEKFYEPEYRLVDVQFLNRTKEVLYIFRDSDNKKIFHKTNDDYYCYQIPNGSDVEARHLVKYDDLVQVKIPYKQKVMLDSDITYEGDEKITTKHAQDYYLQSKGESEKYDLNIMFVDIETYATEKGFPNPEEARDRICMITYHYHGRIVCYVIDNKVLLKKRDAPDIDIGGLIEGDQIIVCKSERELVNNFIKDLKKLDPDIVAGWNLVGFDIPYIYFRCLKIGIKPDTMSHFREVSVDKKLGYSDIAGLVVLDQLVLYKNFVPTRKENYKLGTIGKIELNEEKLATGKLFSELYRSDVNKAIEYNIRDVTIIVGLERKLRHVALQDEVKKISKNSFKGSTSNMGMLDSLMISFLKVKGIASRNSNVHEKKSEFEGAFVKEPIVGVHNYIVDFDFTSLYPNLIITYNVGTNTFVMKFKDFTHGYDFAYNIDNLPDKFKVIIDPTFTNVEVEITKKQLIDKVKEQGLICTINGCFYKSHESELSVYSEVENFLMLSRREYKNKMFEAKQANKKDLYDMYNNRQAVYKIFANALYGVLGNNAFRYFNVDMARTITLSGQETAKHAILDGNAFVNKLVNGEYVKPPQITKQEMFGDLTRKTEFVITGDTDSLFVILEPLVTEEKTEAEKVSKVDEYCDKIQAFLNGEVVEGIVLRHNVPLERNKLELKNELVIRRGLFLSKKHYAINVISEEGKSTDEVIYKGIDVRRSDYPSYSKESLVELLDIILKSEGLPVKPILDFVGARKKEMIKRIANGDKSVARPVTISKEVSKYKKVPYNAIAMLNWNKLMYEAFGVGDRGYLFKINGLDITKAPKEVVEKYNKEFLSVGKKLEYVAVPDEELRLPEWFVIDTKAMLKFAWEDRCNQITDPIVTIKEKILTF